MKKINITTIVLLVYLVVMAYIGRPANQETPDYVEYYGVIGLTLVIIGLLRYVQIRRFKMRQKNKEEQSGKQLEK